MSALLFLLPWSVIQRVSNWFWTNDQYVHDSERKWKQIMQYFPSNRKKWSNKMAIEHGTFSHSNIYSDYMKIIRETQRKEMCLGIHYLKQYMQMEWKMQQKIIFPWNLPIIELGTEFSVCPGPFARAAQPYRAHAGFTSASGCGPRSVLILLSIVPSFWDHTLLITCRSSSR